MLDWEGGWFRILTVGTAAGGWCNGERRKPDQMTTNGAIEIKRLEAAELAFLNWQKDGCRPERVLHHWREAERQIQAVRQSAATETKMPVVAPAAGQIPAERRAKNTRILNLQPINRVPAAQPASSAQSFIPTLLDIKHDGVYVIAFCPLCDSEEKSRIEYPGQPRHGAASVARIRAHLRLRHRKVQL